MTIYYHISRLCRHTRAGTLISASFSSNAMTSDDVKDTSVEILFLYFTLRQCSNSVQSVLSVNKILKNNTIVNTTSPFLYSIICDIRCLSFAKPLSGDNRLSTSNKRQLLGFLLPFEYLFLPSSSTFTWYRFGCPTHVCFGG